MTNATLDEDKFNLSIRKFLKIVGVTSQRELERAVRAALDAGNLESDAPLRAQMTLEVRGIELRHVIEHEIALR